MSSFPIVGCISGRGHQFSSGSDVAAHHVVVMMMVIVIVGAARWREAEAELMVVMVVVGRVEGRVVGVGVACRLGVTRRRFRLDGVHAGQ